MGKIKRFPGQNGPNAGICDRIVESIYKDGPASIDDLWTAFHKNGYNGNYHAMRAIVWYLKTRKRIEVFGKGRRYYIYDITAAEKRRQDEAQL